MHLIYLKGKRSSWNFAEFKFVSCQISSVKKALKSSKRFWRIFPGVVVVKTFFGWHYCVKFESPLNRRGGIFDFVFLFVFKLFINQLLFVFLWIGNFSISTIILSSSSFLSLWPELLLLLLMLFLLILKEEIFAGTGFA